jgi:predicted nucleotidyltransferase component of viral defense system
LIPQANITAWRPTAPWPDDAQVEQDLVLTRALIQLFAEPSLAGRIMLRGGTALHKLYIHPACRFSEDIDLWGYAAILASQSSLAEKRITL